MLVEHPGIDKIVFTGDTSTGKQIMRGSADTLKRITLELGGKSPNIVFPDADPMPPSAARRPIFYGKGEVRGRLAAARRQVHPRGVCREGRRARQKDAAGRSPRSEDAAWRYLVGRDSSRTISVTSRLPRRKEPRWWRRRARRHRHRQGLLPSTDRVCRGHAGNDDCPRRSSAGARGHRVSPTSTKRSRAPTTRPSAWPQRCGRKTSRGALRRAEAPGGTVWINTYNIYDTAAPFGGYKQSGFGREMSVHALEHYTQVKSVWVDLNQ